MPFAHDVELRKSLDEWIEWWRNYFKRHPEVLAEQIQREKQYSQMVAMLESRDTSYKSILCPRCGRTSYNYHDIEHKYCAYCKQYHPNSL